MRALAQSGLWVSDDMGLGFFTIRSSELWVVLRARWAGQASRAHFRFQTGLDGKKVDENPYSIPSWAAACLNCTHYYHLLHRLIHRAIWDQRALRAVCAKGCLLGLDD